VKDTPLIFWVISGKNAFQAFFMFFLIFSGATMASGQVAAKQPLYAVLPSWGVVGFGIALILGGLTNLISVYWPGKASSGILLESWSAMLLTMSCFAFCLLVLATPLALKFADAPSIVALCGLLGLASLGRWFQCRKAIREVAQFKMALAVLHRDD